MEHHSQSGNQDESIDGKSEHPLSVNEAAATQDGTVKSRRGDSAIGSLHGDDKTYFKKYLSAADFIEIQIAGSDKSVRHENEFINLFVALLDRVDFERAANLILQQNYFDQFLRLEKICSVQRKHLERELLIQAMFTQATKLEKEPMALMLALEFESVLLRTTQVVVPVLLSQFERKDLSLNEMKLFIL